MTFNGVGKDVPTFVEASAIADEIMKTGGEYDEVRSVTEERALLWMYMSSGFRKLIIS